MPLPYGDKDLTLHPGDSDPDLFRDLSGGWDGFGFGNQAKSSFDGPQYNDPPQELGEVVVYGSARRLIGWSFNSAPIDDGGWDGNDSDQYVFQPDWGCTGAPDGAAPDDHTMVRVRAVAEAAAARLTNSDLNSSWEWGVLIYMTSDGWLHTTDPFSNRSSGGLEFPYSDSGYLPDGATVVGWVHTHPYIQGEPRQFGMSEIDANAFDTMTSRAETNGNRVSVDPSLMTYVLDRSGNKLFEFDVNDDEGDMGIQVKKCGS